MTHSLLLPTSFLIHDEDTKRLMWSTGLFTEIRPSRDGLIRSVVLKTSNGNHINRAMQCLYPLEVRQDNTEDVVVEEESGLEPNDNPAIQRREIPILRRAIQIKQLEKSNRIARALVGSMLGIYQYPNSPLQGRRSRTPRHLDDYCLRDPR